VEDRVLDIIHYFGESKIGVGMIINEIPVLDGMPLCVSIAPLYFNEFQQEKLREIGIHNFVGYKKNGQWLEGKKRRVAVDSGGFLNLKRGENPFTVEEMIKIYRLCQFRDDDICVSLDFPPGPDVPVEEQYKMIRKTNQNFDSARDMAPDLNLVPVVHGWNDKGIDLSLGVAIGSPVVAIGAFFPLFVKNKDEDLKRKFRIFQDKTLGNCDFEGIKWWSLGANGSLGMHLMAYAGIEITDSSSWRSKAANGKLVFSPFSSSGFLRYEGLSEASVTGKNKSFGAKWKGVHDLWLRECMCPICSGLSLDERKWKLSKKEGGFRNRAIHNASAYRDEKILADELNGTAHYTAYIRSRIEKNYRMKKFFKTLKPGRDHLDLEKYFKEPKFRPLLSPTKALISCSKSKSNKPVFAHKMYTGDISFKSTNVALFDGIPIFYLSSRYGLVVSSDIIEPYDEYIGDKTVPQRKKWASMIIEQMSDSNLLEKTTEIIIYAGNQYREFIVPYLEERGIKVVVPLENMGNGKQKRVLNQKIQEKVSSKLLLIQTDLKRFLKRKKNGS
jgi:hypothetical protein